MNLDNTIITTRCTATENKNPLQAFLSVCDGTVSPSDHKTMLSCLLVEHEAAIGALRKNISASDQRPGGSHTRDFLSKLIGEHEMILTILKRYMNRDEAAGNYLTAFPLDMYD